MAAGQTTWRAVRACLTRLLGSGGGQLRDAPVHEQQRYILPQVMCPHHAPHPSDALCMYAPVCIFCMQPQGRMTAAAQLLAERM